MVETTSKASEYSRENEPSKLDQAKELPREKFKHWTVMVYLAGDNNLAEEMVYALKCMFSAGSTEHYKIFALYDSVIDSFTFEVPTRNSPQGPAGITENHGLVRIRKLEEIRRGKLAHDEVPPVQSALEAFIVNSILSAPAHHYMLVLSGHGSGSVGDFLSARKRSSGLTIPALQETLVTVKDYLQSVRKDLYQQMDILGLDSCQMSTAEVAYQVRDHVGFLVGAEGYEPNTGWPYDLLLSRVNERVQQSGELVKVLDEVVQSAKKKNANKQTTLDAAENVARQLAEKLYGSKPVERRDVEELAVDIARHLVENAFEESSKATLFTFSPKRLAAAIVREYVVFYASDYALADPLSTDLSALDLSKNRIEKFKTSLNTLSDLLVDALGKADQPIKDALVLAHWEAQGYKDEQNVDLWDFCRCLAERCFRVQGELASNIVEACRKVGEQIEDGLVVRNGYCGPAFQHSHGLSVYLPWTRWTDAAGIEDLRHYRTLDFAMDTGWDEFLEAYTKATQRAPRKREREARLDQIHGSSLNRRDWLYTGVPETVANADFDVTEATIAVSAGTVTIGGAPTEIKDGQVTVRDGHVTVRDGQVTVRDGQVTVRDSQDKDLFNGAARDAQVTVRDGQVTVRDGQVTVRDGQVTVRDGSAFSVRDGQVTVRDGQVTVRDGDGNQLFNESIRDGQVTVRDGQVTVRDGQVTVRDGSAFSVRDGQVTVRDGQVTVRDVQGNQVFNGNARDGQVTVRDGQVTVRDGQVTVRDGSMFNVRDGQVTVRDGQVTVRDGQVTVRSGAAPFTVRDGQVTVRDGQVTVRDGQVTVRDGQVTVRDAQGNPVAVRDGQVTVRDGQVTVRNAEGNPVMVRDGQVTVRDGQVTVRDGQVTVRDGQATVRDGQVTVRHGQGATVRDGQVTVRDGQVTVRDASLFSVRDGQVTVRDASLFSVRDGQVTVRGAGVGPAKIASMKNPPVVWEDSDLIP